MRLQADMRQLARVQVLLVHVFARARAAGHCTRPLQPHRASPGYSDMPSPRTTHPQPEIRILNLPPTCRPSPQTPSDDMSHQAGHTHYTQTNKTKTKQACCLRPALRPARQRACWPVSACRPACAPARSLSPRQPCPRTRCAADTRGCPCRRRCRRRAYRPTGYRRACVCQRW